MNEQRGEQLPPLEMLRIEVAPLHQLHEIERAEARAEPPGHVNRQVQRDERLGDDRPSFGPAVCSKGKKHRSNGSLRLWSGMNHGPVENSSSSVTIIAASRR